MAQLQSKVDEALALLKLKSITERAIGDWIKESDAMVLTGLSSSSLYKLRAANRITSSTLTGKAIFYRISDLQRLLDDNEKR